jgi:hypothetical protein
VVLSETLKFQQLTSDLAILKSPTKLHQDINSLLIIGEELFSMAKAYVRDYLRICSDRDMPYQNPALTVCIPNILSLLDFVMNDECGHIIMALKRMAWNKDNCRKDHEWKVPSNEQNSKSRFSDFYNLYGQEYWQGQLPQSVGAGGMREVLIVEYVSWVSLAKKREDRISTMQLQILKRVVEKNIIDPGRLQGATRDEIMRCVDLCSSDLHQALEQYQAYFGEQIKKHETASLLHTFLTTCAFLALKLTEFKAAIILHYFTCTLSHSLIKRTIKLRSKISCI